MTFENASRSGQQRVATSFKNMAEILLKLCRARIAPASRDARRVASAALISQRERPINKPGAGGAGAAVALSGRAREPWCPGHNGRAPFSGGSVTSVAVDLAQVDLPTAEQSVRPRCLPYFLMYMYIVEFSSSGKTALWNRLLLSHPTKKNASSLFYVPSFDKL